MEDKKKEFYCALIKFQSEMPTVAKNRRSNRNTYADLEEVISTAKPFLAKNGLGFEQDPVTIDGIDYLRTTIVHISGYEKITEVKLIPEDKTLQKWGGANTFQKRYALSGALGIVCDDDTDGNFSKDQSSPEYIVKPKVEPKSEAKKETVEPVVETYITNEQVKILSNALTDDIYDLDLKKNMFDYYKIDSWNKLDSRAYDKALNRIHEHRNKLMTAKR